MEQIVAAPMAPLEHRPSDAVDMTMTRDPLVTTNHEDPILQQNEEPIVASVKDHFSLLMPSSKIQFESPGSGARVFELEDGQIILEEDNKHGIMAKQMEDKTTGATLLRSIYTIVTAFWTGFLFVFSLQVLLFLTLDLVSRLLATVWLRFEHSADLFSWYGQAIQLGITSDNEPHFATAVGVFASFPAFISGLSSGLVIGGAFIQDVWRGHSLLRNFSCPKIKQWIMSMVFHTPGSPEVSSVVVEWIFFFFFLGLPIVVMCCLMLVMNDDWWVIGGTVWLGSVFCFFVIFCVTLISFEMSTCLRATRKYLADETTPDREWIRAATVTMPSWAQGAAGAVLLKQVARYSGMRYTSFLSRSKLTNSEAADKGRREKVGKEFAKTLKTSSSLLLKLPQCVQDCLERKFGLYEMLLENEWQQIYTIDDVRDVRPFLTACKYGAVSHCRCTRQAHLVTDTFYRISLSDSWSLERVFCRPSSSRYLIVVSGPVKITSAQISSSLACSIVGFFLMFFLLVSFLVYIDWGHVSLGVGVVIGSVGAILAVPRFISTCQLYSVCTFLSTEVSQSDERSMQLVESPTPLGTSQDNKTGQESVSSDTSSQPDTRLLDSSQTYGTIPPASPTQHDSSNQDDRLSQLTRSNPHNVSGRPGSSSISSPGQTLGPSQVVYYVRQNVRVARATPRLCWVMFALEALIFFVWPLASLFAVQNYPLAVLFIVIASVNGMRYFLDVAVVLQETGDLELINDGEKGVGIEDWRLQNRVSEVVGKITRGRSRGPWMAALSLFGFLVVVLFAFALGPAQVDNAETTSKTNYVYLPDFYYEQKSSQLQYPTCQLSNDLGLSPLKTMADYAYLAGLAYQHTGATQAELDGWFNGSAVNNNDIVKLYRSTVNLTSSHVYFKLITFPNSSNFAYVTIRGTNNQWDMLTDVQLWSAAKLMQLLRELLPLGSIWTPIIPNLIRLVTTVESSNIRKISFYKDTSNFVKWLQTLNATNSSGIAVTGHSLGGGLAIITGAQTGVPAVGLSAPNAMLSRKSFDPPVTPQALNSKTFNIIPDRDIVPRIDDVAKNFQNIKCTTKTQDILGCHDSTRSLCEIIYTCGTGDRPAICQCVTKYGYPEPKPKPGTIRTFAKACGIA